jgi:hypothetical protein
MLQPPKQLARYLRLEQSGNRNCQQEQELVLQTVAEGVLLHCSYAHVPTSSQGNEVVLVCCLTLRGDIDILGFWPT